MLLHHPVTTVFIEATALQTDLTDLLNDWGRGNPAALEKLMPVIYGELQRLATRHLRRERLNHTLQPTALVHEAYIKLVDQSNLSVENRAQFFALASQVMRHILVDHARRRKAAKRGAGYKLSLDEGADMGQGRDLDLLALEEALQDLTTVDSQQARIVELRFFGGLSVEETADVLHISAATVKRDWAMSRAWLYRRMTAKK